MRILLLSDLHIGTSARCLSLVPPEERDGIAIINDNYVERLEELLKKLNKKIDYLLIAGDISHNASFEQFAHFDVLIERILKILNITEQQLFFTAGNHDSDWEAFGKYKTGAINEARFRQRYNPLESSRVLKLSLDSANGNLLDPPYFCVWEDDNALVLSINSASCDGPSAPHHGAISSSTIRALEEDFASRDLVGDSRIKILLLHHHPINYENVSPHWKDFSILQCHVDLLNISRNYGFDFIIHGHRHQPKFQADLNTNGKQLAIVCGGSFSHNFPSYVYDNLSNQLHLLEIDDRDSETGILRGQIFNYAFSHRNGWIPSVKGSCGIEPKISFGPNEHRSALVAAALDYISEKIEVNGSCVIKEMINDNKIFKYKSEDLILDIANEICINQDLEIFGKSVDNSVILKRRGL